MVRDITRGGRRVLFFAYVGLATVGAWGSKAAAQSQAALEPNPFRKTYLHLSLVRNYPEGSTQSTLAPGSPQPAFAYMHDVDRHWLMALGGGLKTFRRPPSVPPQPSPTLAIWSLSHTTYYALRLSYPAYLLAGPRLLYLLPSLAGKAPPQRDHNFDSEIGVGLSLRLIYGFSERWFLSLDAERWRGVKTSRLAGFETGLGVMVALD